MAHTRGTRSTWQRGQDVRLFDVDPGLLDDVPAVAADHLRRGVTVETRWANPGPWDPGADDGAWRSCLGLVLIDGLVIRSVRLDGRDAPELLGPGSVLRPWSADADMASVPHEVLWVVEEPSTVAVLDGAFLAAAAGHPAVLKRLLDRAEDQGRAVAFHLAIANVRCAERRMLMLLWHLADRWGTVTTNGVLLPLRVKQEVLAHLVCLRRPTASSALADLVRTGDISPAAGGGWLLHRPPERRRSPSGGPVPAAVAPALGR